MINISTDNSRSHLPKLIKCRTRIYDIPEGDVAITGDVTKDHGDCYLCVDVNVEVLLKDGDKCDQCDLSLGPFKEFCGLFACSSDERADNQDVVFVHDTYKKVGDL